MSVILFYISNKEKLVVDISFSFRWDKERIVKEKKISNQVNSALAKKKIEKRRWIPSHEIIFSFSLSVTILVTSQLHRIFPECMSQCVCLQCACGSCNSSVFSIQYLVFLCQCKPFSSCPFVHHACSICVCVIDKKRVHSFFYFYIIQLPHSNYRKFTRIVSSFSVGGNNNDVRLKFVVSACADVSLCLCICALLMVFDAHKFRCRMKTLHLLRLDYIIICHVCVLFWIRRRCLHITSASSEVYAIRVDDDEVYSANTWTSMTK